jgi:outer membrane protein assembly factor BamB
MTLPRSPTARRAALRLLATSAAGAALTACSSGGPFGMFGGGKNKEKLAGTRISVLALERALRPNIESIDTQVILPPPQDIIDWPQAGGLSHHAMQHMVLGDSPSLAWRAGIGSSTGKRNRNLAAPIVGGGRVYTIDAKGRVTAFDARNGKRVWQISTPPKQDRDGAFLGGGLAYENEHLFVTGGFAQILALNAANGQTLWRTPVDSPIHSAPTVIGGRVFVVTVENQAVSVAAVNGKVLWRYSAASSPTMLLGGPAPAVDGGVALTAFSNGEIAALRVDSGTPLWSDTVVAVRRTEAAASLPDVAAFPVIDRGRVYAVGHSGILVAIDLRTGQRVWDAPIAGIYGPWIAGDFLYALTLDAEVACIDIRSGHIVWVTQIQRFTNEEKKKGRIVWAGPVLASDRLIVVGSNKEALSMSPYTGEVLSRLKLAAPATLSPVFANGTMYLLNDAGDLTAYR